MFSDWSTQRNHDMLYTFFVRSTVPESRNVKVAMKKFDEKGNEDFCEEEYFNFENLIFGEENTFWKIF